MISQKAWEIPCLAGVLYTKTEIRMIEDKISPIQILFGTKIDLDKLFAVEGPFEEKGFFPYELIVSFTLYFKPEPETPNQYKIDFRYACIPLEIDILKSVLEDLISLWEKYKTQSTIIIYDGKRKIQWEP